MDVRGKMVELTDIQVLQREIECVKRKSATNCADCLNCDLLMTDQRILSAYANAIDALQNANGVTVQEWVSVDEKLPPYNHDVLVYRPNMAMKFLVDNYDGHYGEDDDEWYEGWAKYGTDIHGNPVITHWAYLPKPPKGE